MGISAVWFLPNSSPWSPGLRGWPWDQDRTSCSRWYLWLLLPACVLRKGCCSSQILRNWCGILVSKSAGAYEELEDLVQDGRELAFVNHVWCKKKKCPADIKELISWMSGLQQGLSRKVFALLGFQLTIRFSAPRGYFQKILYYLRSTSSTNKHSHCGKSFL
jgi:hypothetical protein